MTIQANEYSIRPSNQETLLGCIVSEVENEQSMVRQLSSRVNGLSIITSKADFTNDFGKWSSDIEDMLSDTVLGWL